ncbi:MAG: methyltransferase domain-containing protein [Gammaproteobacteria bacterium]|nr:methyltransferase domain-containing protein [Gammaproteobacteria bacterium]
MSFSDKKCSINEWFATSLGAALLEEERQRCFKLIPSGYYPSSLQVGLSRSNFLEKVGSGFRCFVDNDKELVSRFSTASNSRKSGQGGSGYGQGGDGWAVANPEALPFGERTHDLVVLPHTLDFSHAPHEVLRQVNQVLNPEGCVAIIGFNLFSFYGVFRGFNKHVGAAPWNGHYYSVRRVQDWLSLLGFDLVGARMMSYGLPMQNPVYRQKLSFMDRAGDRWWPGLGGVYVIVGRKKEMSMNTVSSRGRRWRQLIPGIVKPAAQPAAQASNQRSRRSSLRLVVDNKPIT